jgi:hypothetical protein
MRAPTDTCLLCERNKSTQQNSHIIPKFFGKGLFYGTNPRHSLSIDKTGKKEKVQDIIKEDYLLCPECEKGLSIFETYCILRLNRFNDIRYFSKFNKIKRGEFEYFECKELDIRIFNLFIYSIVWRASVSESYEFGGFKLPKMEEEKLKVILDKFIKPNQTELIEKLEELNTLPIHSHVIIRPNKKLRPPSAMLSAASRDEWLHEMHLVDFIIFYITDREKLVEGFKEIDNNNLENRVRIGLTTPERWKAYNFELINKAIK